jgi:tRNA U34 2-thiouridine synthase MnmA/TrmU
VPFLKSYQSGTETPNPDVYCNRFVKFLHLRHYIQEKLGTDFLATGHYVRTAENVEPDGSKTVKLFSGKDHFKDQTYFLSMTPVRDVVVFL